MPIDEERAFGIACNHLGNRAIRPNAKCYITWLNIGNGADRVQIWVRSRGGRSIVTMTNRIVLTRFRAAYIPQHVLQCDRISGDPAMTRETAQQIARLMNKTEAGPINIPVT